MVTRNDTHAGSWYTDHRDTLDTELDEWLDQVDAPSPVPGCKAIIAPHAGYSYSGPTAAWAYKSIDVANIERVFILGPSHHVYLDGCALSKCTTYRTPIGDLPLDLETISELRNTGVFENMTRQTDEEEHSIEMHLPYIRKIFQDKAITIVPILVGSISAEKERHFGEILAPYLAAPDTLFVISSDFCHWGTRFSYTFYYPSAPAPPPSTPSKGIRLSRTNSTSQISPSFPIHASITALDHEAMSILTLQPGDAAGVHDEFTEYLARTKNTICGRHPIGVLLGTLAALEEGEGEERKSRLEWVKYAQSSACVNIRDSSVSYASAYVVV